jgi:hypothetical protein
MLKKILLPTVVSIAALLLLLTFRPGQAQQDSARYFPQSGHYVDEPFLSFFQENGGLQVWGPPLTEAFEDSGRLVQYFERGRIECTLQGQEEPCEPSFSPLGELLGHQTPRVAPVPEPMLRDELCRYFPETGHNVCFTFLDYYLAQGGPDVLGPPISELVVEPGVIVQYFSRARIEWHVEAGVDGAMGLGALGHEHFLARGLDPALLAAAESPGVAATTTPLISVGGYVRVVNTEGTGLRMRAGAGLNLATIETLQDGDLLRVVAGPENADGFAWWQLDHDGVVGWCASEWLEPVAGPGTP